jgi:hypothetical protein
MLTWREWRGEREVLVPQDGRRAFANARLLVDARDGTRLYLGWSRGGAFKLFSGERLVRSDTGPTLRMRDGRVAVTHLEGIEHAAIEDDRIELAGRFAWTKAARLTPAKSIVLRTIMLTGGRFFPDLIRRLLQKLLVTGRKDAPFRWRRVFAREGTGWRVRDEIAADAGWGDVAALGTGGFQTSVTTIMARVWQADQMQPWEDHAALLANARSDAPIVIERALA